MKNITSTKKMDTMSECISAAVKSGYTKDFIVDDTGLSFEGSHKLYQPEDVIIKDFYRFEGESDPGDSSILYLLKTRDGERGTLIDAYGMYSDMNITEFVKEVDEIHKRMPKKGTNISRRLRIGAGIFIAAAAAIGLYYSKSKAPAHRHLFAWS